MAVDFAFKISPGLLTVSLPGTDFDRTFEVVLGGGKNISSEIEIMKRLTVVLHRETQRRMPYKYLALKLFDQFDYTIESGSEILQERLEQLADALQVHLRIRRLSINGRDLTIPLWRRNLEYWLRMFLVKVIPLVMMIFSYYFMPAFFRSNPLFFLAVLFVVFYLFRFLGKGLWILSLQRLVTRGYLNNLLLARRTRIGWPDRFWLKLFSGPIDEK
jgi:hypothetical protein